MQEETWATLMRAALRVIDSLNSNGYGALDFRLGGGTVLMFTFDHRVSKDIDIFFHDAQALGYLSPRLNDVAGALAKDYAEQGNSVKLVLPEGDIDFIVAGTVMPREAIGSMAFEGRVIKLDATAEILAKKVLYRAASLKPRDVFDLATALDRDPVAATGAIAATTRVHDVLLRRLASLADADEAGLWADIRPTRPPREPFGRVLGRLRAAITAGGREAAR